MENTITNYYGNVLDETVIVKGSDLTGKKLLLQVRKFKKDETTPLIELKTEDNNLPVTIISATEAEVKIYKPATFMKSIPVGQYVLGCLIYTDTEDGQTIFEFILNIIPTTPKL